jgi:hypothetical protein
VRHAVFSYRSRAAQDWVRQERMGTFMAVAQGSDEPLKFLEIEYTSATRLTEAPVVLVFLSYTRHLFDRNRKTRMHMWCSSAAAAGACRLFVERDAEKRRC